MSIDALSKDLERARAVYSGHFAGQPRYSRQLPLLEELIATARRVAREAFALEASDLASSAEQQLAAWTDELAAVQGVQGRGPHAIEAASLAQWVRDNHERYRRHFAGQLRPTRDLGILDEIIADLDRRQAEIEVLRMVRADDPELERAHADAEDGLTRYRKERLAIRSAQRDGANDERIRRLVLLANDQYARYQLLFAGKPRLSRRAQTLRAIVTTLETLRHDWQHGGVMPSLAQQSSLTHLDKQLTAYRAEVKQIEETQAEAPHDQRAGSLGGAANEVFQAYRDEFAGKDRSTREPKRMADLWEQLWPIALEMDHLSRTDESVLSNLQIVRDALRRYEREWQLIRDARESKS